MKALHLTLALVVLASAVHAEWRSIFAKSSKPPLETLPLVKRDGTSDFIFVKNTSKETLFYQGYLRREPQLFFEEQKDGVWIDTGWMWCGTGMNGYSLEPGDSIYFKIKPSTKNKERAYMVFTNKDRKSESLVLLWETP